MKTLKELFLTAEKDLRLKRSILGCILCIIFIPAGTILDYFLYYNFLRPIAEARLLCSLLILGIFLVHFSEFGKKNIRILTITWLLLVSCTMSWIIFVTDKYESTYYAALSIFIFSVAVILPLSTLEMLVFCLSTIGLYLVAAFEFPLMHKNILLNNLYFIGLTSIISTIAIHLNSALRFKEFCLNHKLKSTITTLKSTQAQLVQSEKINAIGSLSAGLLHEVNNPLNYTITALQLVKMDPHVNSDADLKETVHDIEEGMMRIKNIVTDLRSFAYPEEADKQNQFPILNAIESSLRFTAAECQDIERKIDVAPNLMVVASKTHIVQVLINLITNASRAINKTDRKGLIKIGVEEKNGRAIVSVSDNGIGMSPETLKKVFDPFFTTNEVGKGMGLGLSVSHTIIKNHGGKLAAESVLGEGSKFYFDLPG